MTIFFIIIINIIIIIILLVDHFLFISFSFFVTEIQAILYNTNSLVILPTLITELLPSFLSTCTTHRSDSVSMVLISCLLRVSEKLEVDCIYRNLYNCKDVIILIFISTEIFLKALCSSCCNMKFFLPYLDNKEGRVCQVCCNALLRGNREIIPH